MKGNILEGDGTWGWTAEVDGQDIVKRSATMTWFGVDDPQDNGMGCWGFHVAGNPTFRGVALPMAWGPCAGSPIPVLPHDHNSGIGLLTVQVYSHKTGKVVECKVVDQGPAKELNGKLLMHQIDAMPSVWEALGIPNFREEGETLVDFRIIGGAQHIPGYTPQLVHPSPYNE